MRKRVRVLQAGRSSLSGVLALSMVVALLILLIASLASPKQPRPTVADAQGQAPVASPGIAATVAPPLELVTATAVVSLVPTEATPGVGAIVQVLDSREIVPQKPCAPMMAPTGDRYLCYAEGPELWLGTLSGGLDRVLLKGQLVHFRWAYDDQHIVYSPWADPPIAPTPQSVSLMDIETGETTELGQTIRGALIKASSSGYIAFLQRDSLRIINPLLKIEAEVPIAFGPELLQPEQPLVGPLLQKPEPTKWPDFLLTPGPTQLAPEVTSVPPLPGHWSEAYSYFQVFFEVSPDGQKVALMQVAMSYFTTLSIADVKTGEQTIISHQLDRNAGRPFSWSQDSKTLAYGINDKEIGPPELWLVDADGSNPRLLWAAGEDRLGHLDELTWLPKKDLILFGHVPSGTDAPLQTQYQVISSRGGEPEELFVGGYGLQVTNGGHKLTYVRFSLPDVENSRTVQATLAY